MIRYIHRYWFEFVCFAVVCFFLFFGFPALIRNDRQAHADRAALEPFERHMGHTR